MSRASAVQSTHDSATVQSSEYTNQPAGVGRWVLGEGAAGRLAGKAVLNLFSYSCAIGPLSPPPPRGF